MIIVTGGAGFIGSGLVWGLNERGREDILIVDSANHQEQEHNLAAVKYEALIDGESFREKLKQDFFDDGEIEAVLHMGAISSTTEDSWEKLEDVNIAFTQEIIRWCVDRAVRCIYASSGATYGDGGQGYSDDHEKFEELKPLNLYGKSKLVLDIWARDGGYLNEVVGLRYFNVFGPNEYHKGHMRSVMAKKFKQIRDGGVIELFKSNDEKYKDGGQKRDFLYIKDAIGATLHFLNDNKEVGGVFNVGTGRARTWNDVAETMFASLDKKANIRYVDIPPELAKQYQNFTQADITKLRAAGFKEEMTSLEEAMGDYIKNYLANHLHLGEA
ncbi:MAG: ADP-glyceromanno-heptose 6-epimerase [bacterium]